MSVPAGIAIGFTDTDGILHAQAFSINSGGEIIWLILFHGEVQIGKMDNFYPYEFMTAREFEDRYIEVKEFTEDQMDSLLRQLYLKRLE